MGKQISIPARGDAPATGGRMLREVRRQQLVDVAMRVFSERGFRGTTTKEIAQAAGVSEAIIFRHFTTKEELYTAIIDHKACQNGAHAEQPIAERLRCSVAEAMSKKDDRAVFEGIATMMMRHHEEDTEFLRLLFYSALEGHQLSQMFWDRNVRMMYEFLGAYIHERQREKSFREADPLVVVRAFTGMIIHHSVTNTLWDKSRSLLNISNEAAAREFTNILLRGITTGDATHAASTPNGAHGKRATSKLPPAKPTASSVRAGKRGEHKRNAAGGAESNRELDRNLAHHARVEE
ncbi:MAG TPA: helix-turn-helix domain-containing protein [Pyrinomonadaceae bacterium]|jgi:AcrR family transcriptional regulator|nr:helix-turn-helix domain-containing protein [Pyrinomonadaceae bacterium]